MTEKYKIILLIICLLFFELTEGGINVGDTPPDIQFLDLEGNSHYVNELKGFIVWLNFWGSWCAPCLREIPQLNEINKKYESDGFKLVGIAFRDKIDRVKNAVTSKNIEYEVWFDFNNKVEKEYGFTSAPIHILLDRDGKVYSIKEGTDAVEPTRDILNELLNTDVDSNKNNRNSIIYSNIINKDKILRLEVTEGKKLIIYSIKGEKEYYFKLNKNNSYHEIYLPEIKSGIYFIMIETDDVILVRKLVFK